MRRGSRKVRPPLGDLSDQHSFASRMAQYLAWMGVTNYSERSIDNARKYISHLITWCAERGLTRPMEVTRPILERYQRYLFLYRKPNGQPLGVRSQHHHLVQIRGFFRWLTRQNFLLYNPASELELPRLEARLPKHVLTASEAEQVIALPDVGEPLGLRNRAILETLYSTGLRRIELVRLKITDLDMERGTLMVRQGKGKKDRMIPIGERAVVWIDKYLREVRPSLVMEPDEGYLFLTHKGESFAPIRLTQMVRDYVDAAKLGKVGSCHLFRHTMATLMLEGGADIRFIQQMLGHANLSTTQLYTQVSIRLLKEIHSVTHPAAKLERAGQKSASTPETEEAEARAALLSSLAAEADEEADELEEGPDDRR